MARFSCEGVSSQVFWSTVGLLSLSFPPLPRHSPASVAAGEVAASVDAGTATDPTAASLASPMSLTEDEMQHERNVFAENVSLGLYQPTPIPYSPSSSSFNKKSNSSKTAASVATATTTSSKRNNIEAAAATGEDAGNEMGAECTVCYERAVDSVLYTCGHCCMCYDCAWECKQTRGGLCPICRAPIRDVIRIYRS